MPRTPLPQVARQTLQFLERRSPGQRLVLELSLVTALALTDFFTGADVAMTALYLVPITAAAWFGSRARGRFIAGACTFSWIVARLAGAEVGPHAVRLAWNIGVELTTFLFAATLVHDLRLALVEERRALVAAHERTLATQMQLQHAERLSTVGRLAAGVAHELGTPLNVVGAYAQMIETGAVAGGAVVESARIVREQSEAMTRIIRQLVDFARAGTPHRSLQRASDLLGASASLLRPLAQKKSLTLAVEAGDDELVEADAGQLQQVIANLVVNAIHATPPRGHVWLHAAREQAVAPEGIAPSGRGWVVLRVRDDGPGIPPDVAPHLFEPFFTTKDVGEGTGLGLAVAHGIVREHGGWIRAGNGPSGGAQFEVLLPAPTGATS